MRRGARRLLRWARTRRSLPSGDAGSAVVEFVTIGVLLLVPVVYLVLTLGRVQAASFAAEGAAREAVRLVVAAPTAAEGEARAVAATGWALRDQGFGDDPGRALTVTCSAAPCLTPGADVQVTVRVDVPLPGVPVGVSAVLPTVVPVSATHVQVVDEYRAES